MNVFNRGTVILIGIIVLAGAAVVLLISAGVSTPDLLPGGFLTTYLQNVADATGSSAVIIMVVSGIVALCMVLLIVFEIITASRKSSPPLISMNDSVVTTTGFKAMSKQDILVISSTEKGTTSIDVQSICDLVENVAITVYNMHRFDCKIGRNSDGLLLSCRAVAALGSNAVEVAAKSRSRVTEAIEQLTGLAVARVDIKILYDKSKKEIESLTVH